MGHHGPILICGPTASGKSALAMDLAEKLGAEIVSVDSFCIYRGLDIGTSKPTQADRMRVPHHLIDCVGPLESFSVVAYLAAAEKPLLALKKRHVPSIWVGGAGLYFRALRQGICNAPASDPEQLAELETWSTQALVDELTRVDPTWCAHADLQNRRRLIRALAVYRQTGVPFSAWQKWDPENQPPPLLPEEKLPAFYIDPPRELLAKKMTARVEDMIQRGWIEEVRALMKLDGWLASQSAAALGYRVLAEHVQGKFDQEEAQARIVTQTRQFAKRQHTWFRAEKNLHRWPHGCWTQEQIDQAAEWVIKTTVRAG